MTGPTPDAGIERIYAPATVDGGGGLLAVIIKWAEALPGVTFVSDPAEPLQVGILGHPAGHTVPAHTHRPIPRAVSTTQEVLFVREGWVRLDLYAADGTPAGTRHLFRGDVAVLVSGGHGLYVLQDCSIVEVKQGPYFPGLDKMPLSPRS